MVTDSARVMRGLSTWTWEFLDAAGQAGFSPREETLTETILVELATLGDGLFLIDKKSMGEESKDGADFAWALRRQGGDWLHLLVQAKKLNPRIDLYATGAAEEQLEKLTVAAKEADALPTYLFYSDSSLALSHQLLRFGRCRCWDTLIRGDFGPPWMTPITPAGCSLAPANAVRRQLSTAARLGRAGMLEASMPWECSLCPRWQADDPFGERPDGGPDEVRSIELRDDRPPWLTLRAPAWASAIQEEGWSIDEVDSAPAAKYFLVAEPEYDDR